MTVMQTESAPIARSIDVDRGMSVQEIVAEMRIAIAQLEASLARAQVGRLQEQLQWERAYRRRGLLGRLFS